MPDRTRDCAILLDDTQRKPVCRLYLNSSQRYVGFFDNQRHEQRVAIDDVDDIYNYADRLKDTVSLYEKSD